MVPRREPPPRPSSRRSFFVGIPSLARAPAHSLARSSRLSSSTDTPGSLTPFFCQLPRNSCTPYRGLKTCVSKHVRAWVYNRCRLSRRVVSSIPTFWARSRKLLTPSRKVAFRGQMALTSESPGQPVTLELSAESGSIRGISYETSEIL